MTLTPGGSFGTSGEKTGVTTATVTCRTATNRFGWKHGRRCRQGEGRGRRNLNREWTRIDTKEKPSILLRQAYGATGRRLPQIFADGDGPGNVIGDS